MRLLQQVDQILSMRSELVETTEKVRRLESEKEQLETDMGALKQQVRASVMREGGRAGWLGWSTKGW